MGFLSDLGNVLHSIGHFVSGGDSGGGSSQINNNPTQKKPQQNNLAPQQPQPGAVIQPQNNQPAFNLFQGPNNSKPTIDPNNPLAANRIAANNFLDQAGTLQKPGTPPQAQPAGPPHASIIHDIFHNPVTNGVGTALKDTGEVAGGIGVGAAEGVLRAGEGAVTGIEGIPNLLVHAATKPARMIANAAGDNNLPIVQDLNKVDQQSQRITNDATDPVNWLANKTDDTIGMLNHENGDQTLAGRVAKDIYTPAQVAGNVAALVASGGATASADTGELSTAASFLSKARNVFAGQNEIPVLSKIPGVGSLLSKLPGVADTATSATDAGKGIDASSKGADEVATGLKSSNPTQVQDAIDQTNTKAAQDAANGGVPPGSDTPPQDTPTQDTAPTPQPTGTPQTVQPASDVQPTSQPGNTPAVPAEVQPAEAQSLQNSSSPNNVSQSSTAVKAGEAENTPQLRVALNKQVTDFDKRVTSEPGTHTITDNPDLTKAAEDWGKSYTDGDLANQYANPVDLSKPSDMAKANVTMQRLLKTPVKDPLDPDDPVNKAVSNIVDSLAQKGTDSAQSLRYLQEIYGNLPPAAKIPILIRNIDKARELAGMPLLKDNLPLQQEVTSKLNNLMAVSQDIAKQRDTTIEEVEKAAQNLTSRPKGEPLDPGVAKGLVKTGREAQVTIKQANNALEKNQGDLAKVVKEYGGSPATTLMKGGAKNVGTGKAIINTITGAGKSLAEAQKSLMLASLAGPLNDSTLSGMNAIRELTNMAVTSANGKMLNAVTRSPGKFTSQLPSVRTLARGSNLSKTGGEMFKGNLYTPDALTTLASKNGSGRTGLLQKADNKFMTKFNARVHATREAATNLTAGMKDVKIQQLANQEAKAKGLTGDAANAYTALRTANPTRAMTESGVKLTQEVNNMNDNPLSRALGSKGGGVLGGVNKIPGVGPLIQNLFQPFSQWVGSQAWNAITDQNVVANLAKAVGAGVKGDAQGVVDNLSKLTVNATTGMTAGYALAHSGYLTTNHGTSSSANDGLYLHFGNNYIPVTFLGGAAPSIIMGYSAYNSMHGNPQGSLVENTLKTAQGTLETSAKAYAGGTPIGGTNALFGPYGIATQAGQVIHPAPGQKTTWGDVGSNLATNEAGMFIPGGASDVNSMINATNADPTHTAPATTIKTLNSKTGNMDTNQIASNNAYLKSRIPILSQGMPRDLTKAAPTFLSRYTRGSNTTGAEVQTAKDLATQTQSVQDDIKNGIPIYKPATGMAPKGYSFSNTMDTAVQTGKYDNAIQGYQSELKYETAPGPLHIPPSTVQSTKDKIAQLQVAQSAKLSYSDMQQYNGTSLTAWRDMGDPKSNSYDPATYQKLYAIDQALAAKGVAGGFTVDSSSSSSTKVSATPKYSAKAVSSGSSGSSAASLAKSNKVGSLPSLVRESFLTNLAAKDIPDNIPQMKLTAPESLIKPHAISVKTAA